MPKWLRNLFYRKAPRHGLKYWEIRAAQYGQRAVLNLGHRDDEFDFVTELQKREIYPSFVACLKGAERVVLDFGCGVGRFTPDLAVMTGGNAIGVDPIRLFLEMAPKAENVQYIVADEGVIPLKDRCVDVVWICLVLGGIREGRCAEPFAKLIACSKLMVCSSWLRTRL